jgi:hypothetical protein
MAFSFPGTPPAASAAGVNIQSGPDLEDIQTEVHYTRRLFSAIVHC